MASADFSGRHRRSLSTALALSHRRRSPRVSRTDFHAYARRIYFRSFRARTGLWVCLPSRPLRLPHMRFLFVRPAFCLQLPSDSASRPTPLLFG